MVAGALRGRVLTDNAGDTIRGIGLAAAAYGILSIGDASAKWVILSTGVAWVLMWRGLFGALAVGAVTVARSEAGGWWRLIPVRVGYVMLRAVLSSHSTASVPSRPASFNRSARARASSAATPSSPSAAQSTPSPTSARATGAAPKNARSPTVRRIRPRRLPTAVA